MLKKDNKIVIFLQQINVKIYKYFKWEWLFNINKHFNMLIKNKYIIDRL